MAKKSLIFLCGVAFISSAFFIPAARGAAAAGFIFTPTSGAYISGSTIVVMVSVDTKGNPINAADGTISFPTDLLRVTSISKASSIFKFWVQDPTYSNTDGTIAFSGGLPTPGFAGSSGTVFTVTFKALGSGIAKLKVTDGSILANDGMGTNILAFNEEPAYQISSAIKLAEPVAPKEEKPAQIFGVPKLPTFTSRTHPNERIWYAAKTFEIAWNLPSDVDGVNYALVKDANYHLVSAHKGLVDHASYDISDFEDGVWYFYAQFHNKSGWGAITSRAIQIDILPPYPFTITRTDRGDDSNPNPIISFNATDDASPISRYEISIDNADPIDATTLKRDNGYVLPTQLPGSHLVSVRAYDSALNYTDSLLQVDVKPLVSPQITSYTANVSPPQKPFVISGKIPKHNTSFVERVVIMLSGGSENDTFETPVNSDGTWVATFSDRLTTGEYTLVAYLTDSRGARSIETQKKTANVGGWLSDTLASVGEYSVVGIAMIVGFGLMIAVALYFYSRLLKMRKRLFNDIKRFEQKLDTDLRHMEKDLTDANNCDENTSAIVHKKKQKHLVKDIEMIETEMKNELDNLKDLKRE